MKKLLVVLLLIFGAFSVQSRQFVSVQDGRWTEPNTWSEGQLPALDDGDTIVVNTRVELDVDITLGVVYMHITELGVICSETHGITLDYGSVLYNEGTLAVAYINVFAGTLINDGLIRTRVLYIDTKSKNAEVINNAAIFVHPNLDNACPKPPTPVDTIVVIDTVQLPDDTLTFCLGESPDLPYSKANYLWETGAMNSEFVPERSGRYAVTVTSKISGQQRETSVYILLKPSLGSVPNVFSPNGDGYNDVFLPDNFGLTRLRIMSRWGNTIFDDSVVTPTSFEDVSDGVYFYVLEHANECTTDNPIKGWVHIMR